MRAKAAERSSAVIGGAARGGRRGGVRLGGRGWIGRGDRLPLQDLRQLHLHLRQLFEHPQTPFGPQDRGVRGFGGGGVVSVMGEVWNIANCKSMGAPESAPVWRQPNTIIRRQIAIPQF